jgi:hypothetical protein
MIWKMPVRAGKSLWIDGRRFFHSGDSRALDGAFAETNTRPTQHPGVPHFPSSSDDSGAYPGRTSEQEAEDVHRPIHMCGWFCGQFRRRGGVATR